jgi:hypothetical protein
MKTILRCMIAVPLVLAAAGAQSRVGGLALDDPPQLFGNCNPTRVHFNGRINATGPLDVTYTWIRSDHAQAPTHVLHFTRSGPLTINYDWTLKGNASGWVTFKILAPLQKESNPVRFEVNCGR